MEGRGRRLRSPSGAHARRVGAAIAVTGLKIALQTGHRNLYDTSHQAIVYSGPSAAMEDPRVGGVPLVDGRPAATTGQAGLDSTIDLVERAKTGDAEALNRLFARFLPSLRRWASGR